MVMHSFTRTIELKTYHSYYHTYYDDKTVNAWKDVWDAVLNMAYLQKDKVERIIVTSENPKDNEYYSKKIPSNYHDITFESAWLNFCAKNKIESQVVPQLKEIFVPKALFECLGVYSFFMYSFPNCVIKFWD